MTQTLTITEFQKSLKKVQKGTKKGTSYLVCEKGHPLFRVEPPPFQPQRKKKYSPLDILDMIRKLPKRKGPKTDYSLRVDEILYGDEA